MSSPSIARHEQVVAASECAEADPFKEPWSGYMLAVGVVSLAAFIEAEIVPWCTYCTPYLMFYPAVTLSAWGGGMRAGLLATLLASAFVVCFSLLPGSGCPFDWLKCGIFLFVCVMVASISGALRQARFRAGIAEAEARHAAEQKRTSAVAARCELMIRYTRDPVLLMEMDGTIADANEAGVKLYGYRQETLIGMNIKDLRCGDRPETVEAQLREAFEKGILLETVHYGKDGVGVPVEVNSRGVIFDDRPMLLSVVRDITERRLVQNELRRSEEMHRVFFEQGAVGMVHIGNDGCFLSANDKFCEITGYSKAELSGLRILDLTHVADRECAQRDFERHIEGRLPVYAMEKRYCRKDGSVAWVAVTARLVSDPAGRMCHSVGIIEDVTARKQAEAALRMVREELEIRVEERTVALRRANRALLVLKKCNEAVARASDEAELLNHVCEILVKIGEAKMAWVGFARNNQGKTVYPVAAAGDDTAYLKAAKITWADKPKGRGPTGIAIRNREVCVSHDIANDPRVLPWREEQSRRGYAASIALPLIEEDRCLGALMIYSAEADAFNQEEVDLFKQMADDLTYGIVALRTRADRARLQRELLSISEREKQLISQELHDGLCQNLAAAAMVGSLLQKRLAVREDAEAPLAKNICEMLSASVNEARHLSHGMQPVGADGEALMDALAQLAVTVGNLFGMDCAFDCPEPVLLENEAVSTHLFRIAQEAINNARRHGQAHQVVIGLKNVTDGIVLTIRDDGIGIPKKLPRKCGMGLRSMERRASEIGATLTVERVGKAGGTLVRCALPRCAAAAGSKGRDVVF